MRKINLMIVFMAVYVLFGCSIDIAPGTPGCVEEKIKDFSKGEACDSGAKVSKYIFQTYIVYVFDPGICGSDFTSEVIGADCETIGFLGGIVGNIIINGEEFSNAILQEVVWNN